MEGTISHCVPIIWREMIFYLRLTARLTIDEFTGSKDSDTVCVHRVNLLVFVRSDKTTVSFRWTDTFRWYWCLSPVRSHAGLRYLSCQLTLGWYLTCQLTLGWYLTCQLTLGWYLTCQLTLGWYLTCQLTLGWYLTCQLTLGWYHHLSASTGMISHL
jgi:hypothetical protein